MSEEISASCDFWRLAVSVAAKPLDALTCLTELIDNSLDSGSSLVEITVVQGKQLLIKDDGDGIANLQSLVTWGGHIATTRRGRARSGTYGVGFKDAALWFCADRDTAEPLGSVDVRTVREELQSKGNDTAAVAVRMERRARIDWKRLQVGDKCMTLPDAEVTEDPSGTEITIRPLSKRFPDGQRRPELVDHLAYIYYPAMNPPTGSGRRRVRIFLKAGPGAPIDLSKHTWKPPPLTDVIDEQIVIGRKRAHLRAGIVMQGHSNPKPGLTYTHGYRVIKSASGDGCGMYSKQRIWGYVAIASDDHGWTRTTNKTNLQGADDLYEEVERLLTPILKKADQAAHEIEEDEGRRALECALEEVLDEKPTDRAKRGPRKTKSGTVEPTNEGPKHEQAANTNPGGGNVRQKKPKRCLRLEFVDGWKEGLDLGYYEETSLPKIRRVSLYRDHPWIARSRVPFDNDRLLFAAMVVVHMSEELQERQLQLISPGRNPRAAELARKTASGRITLDGMTVSKAAE